METATFGTGCFWGAEETFRQVEGVASTEVGYSGGATEDPTYEEVCTNGTGHAEVVRVAFDPSVVSYERLLGVFWGCHDPTQVNRQGPDVGTQYRSVIFYHTPGQQAVAEASKKKLGEPGRHATPTATAIEPAGPFYRAEEHHQRYFEKRGGGTCPTT